MEKIKAAVIAIFGILSAWLGVLAIPVYLLVFSNVADYITGIMASVSCKEAVSSYRSMRGIMKKVSMWLLVGVGAAVDWLLLYAGQLSGSSQEPLQFVIASLVAVWLVTNELLSILENIQKIGVKLPPFLVRILKGIQDSTEAQAENQPPEKKQ